MVDRIIQKKYPKLKRNSIIAAATLSVAVLVWLLTQTHSSELNTNKNKLTIAKVKTGEFREYIAIDGTVLPIKTIYLDAVEGGRVAERYVEDGDKIREGQPILKLVNTDLQLDFLQR
ncbi:MAG: efflux RND transporter periplasmic adaptor subunit, partial [Bacteroidota bacterium]